jgi:hypothetical protein
MNELTRCASALELVVDGGLLAQQTWSRWMNIISLLKEFGVKGAMIEWYEGSVETLAGPPVLHVTLNTDPTSQVRRFLTAALGMPISTKEREDDDAQGSVGFFFHENKTKSGELSDRVFGVSDCHAVVSLGQMSTK